MQFSLDNCLFLTYGDVVITSITFLGTNFEAKSVSCFCKLENCDIGNQNSVLTGRELTMVGT
jgi:hypothetical protein